MIPAFNNGKLWKRMIPILKSWENTPYRHMEMVKKRGADCTMFLAACFHELGVMVKIDAPDYYSKDWQVHTEEELVRDNLIRHLENHLAKGFTASIFEKGEIEADDFIRGDLIGFKTPRSRCTNHTAMWLGNGFIVNCIQGGGVCNLEWNRAWNRIMTTVFRIMVKE